LKAGLKAGLKANPWHPGGGVGMMARVFVGSARTDGISIESTFAHEQDPASGANFAIEAHAA
jgi:hypothetical protein